MNFRLKNLRVSSNSLGFPQTLKVSQKINGDETHLFKRYLKVLAVVKDDFSKMYQEQVNMVLSGSDLMGSMEAFKDLGSDTQERLNHDTGHARFEQMLKASKALSTATSRAQESVQEEALPTEILGEFSWGGHSSKIALELVTVFKGLLLATDLVDALTFKASQMSDATTQAINHVQEVTKGYFEQTENSWKYTLAEGATLDDVMVLAKKTVETLNLEHVETGIMALTKACSLGEGAG